LDEAKVAFGSTRVQVWQYVATRRRIAHAVSRFDDEGQRAATEQMNRYEKEDVLTIKIGMLKNDRDALAAYEAARSKAVALANDQ